MSAAKTAPDQNRRARARTRDPALTAVVLRRSDFRETSRIVTLLTHEQGRVVALAKGAHRPGSPFVGRLDFLNEVRATVSADRGGLRLLTRVELVRERRALRQPARFLAASHLAQLCDFAMPDAGPQPAVYELLAGGLSLLERCPPAAIGPVVLGLELRHLALLGALPDFEHCSACGDALGGEAYQDEGPGLVCREHAEPPRRPVPAAVLELLRQLRDTPGRQWPGQRLPTALAAAATLPARWLAHATEQRSRLRPLLFARLLPPTR
ncbi:MAG: DNA repair protein RecO [Planctomycetes bacterium]|nr:DNA repair protein RecO [Planctomycetota bacterium]